MPKTSTGGLRGGRALYRTRDAYASQGFEDDTRQSRLGGLVVARLWENVVIPGGGVDTLITFPAYVSMFGPSIFLRGFYYKDGTFYCNLGGTYRISLNLRTGDVPANSSATSAIQVTRGVNTFRQLQAVSNTDAVTAGSFFIYSDVVLDLLPGDVVQIYAASIGGGFTVSGGTNNTSAAGGVADNARSYMTIEQIDLPSPA